MDVDGVIHASVDTPQVTLTGSVQPSAGGS